MNEIMKGKVRIFTPNEFELLLNAIPKNQHKLIIKSLLFTGMRFTELQRLKKNPSWLKKDGFIHLPEEATFKEKRKQKDRYVKLTSWGSDILTSFLDKSVKLPKKQSLNEDLKRWSLKCGIGDKGVSIKTFRKTCVSWLISIYKENVFQICLSIGNSELTSLKHYVNLPFTETDKQKMLRYFGGINW